VKLLRLLETGSYRRVGGVEPLKADFRLVAATHRDLVRLVQEERFRSDLYYRISAFPIQLPALRERRADIPLLAESLLGRLRPDDPPSISATARRQLSAYDFPGNIRELRNILERASLLADDGIVHPRHLPAEVTSAARAADTPQAGGRLLRTAERDALQKAFDAHRGGRRDLARSLGLSERTLYRKLRQLGIERDG
jgi:DNA-binding NtrC family response regulator